MIRLGNFRNFGKLTAEKRWSLARDGRNRRFVCSCEIRDTGDTEGSGYQASSGNLSLAGVLALLAIIDALASVIHLDSEKLTEMATRENFAKLPHMYGFSTKLRKLRSFIIYEYHPFSCKSKPQLRNTVELGVSTREAKRATTLCGFQARAFQKNRGKDVRKWTYEILSASLLCTLCSHSVLSNVHWQRFLHNTSPAIFVTGHNRISRK